MKNTKTSDTALSAESQKKALKIKRIFAVSFCVLLLVAFLYCYIRYGKEMKEIFKDTESLQAFLARFNGYDKLVFVAIRTFQTVIKLIPAGPLEIGSGVLYGTWQGMLLCMIGTEIGSLIAILLTKVFGRKIVDLFVPVENIDSLGFLQNKKNVYFTLFIIYLIPATPKDIITYLAAITNMNMVKFLILTGIARIPSILVSTYVGKQFSDKSYNLAIIIFAISMIITFASSIMFKKYLDKNKIVNSDEEEKDDEV